MEKNNPKLELTQDEKGQLNGGYALQSSTTNGMENHFFSDNGNCKGDGWFDDNVTAAAALVVTSTLAWKHSSPYIPKIPLGISF